MLYISRHIDRIALPPRRTVIEFDFHGEPARRMWMTLERDDISVCLTHPELPIDLTVRTTVRERVAQDMIDSRVGDGRNAPVLFTKPPAPGVWRPTPPAFAPVAVPWLGG